MTTVLFNDKEIPIDDNLIIEKKSDNLLILKLNGDAVGEIKGEVLTLNRLNGYWIHSIIIYDGYRNKGYGKVLIKALLEDTQDITIYGVDPVSYDNSDIKNFDTRIERLKKWYESFSVDGKKIEILSSTDIIYQKLANMQTEGNIEKIKFIDRIKAKFNRNNKK